MSDDAARPGQGDTPWAPPEPHPQAPTAPPGGAPQAHTQPAFPQPPHGQAQQPGAFPPPPYAQPAGAPVKMARPWTFSGAMGLLGLALLCALGNAVLVLTNGRDMLGDIVDDIIGPGVPSELRQAAIDEAYDTLSARAGISLFFGLVVLGFAIPTLFRLNWSRIVVTCVLPVLLLVSLRNVTDDIPGVMRALEGIALASGLVFFVLVWLGPSNRYIRSRKQAAAPTMPQPPYPGWA